MSVRLTRERSWVRAPLLPLKTARVHGCTQAVFSSYFLSQKPNFFVRNITLHYDYLTSIEFQPKLWYIGFSQRWRGPVLALIRADQTGPSPRLWAKWWAGTWQGSYTHGNLCQGQSPGFFVNPLSVSYFSIFNLSILILFYFIFPSSILPGPIFPYPIFPYPILPCPIFPCPKSTPPRSSHILLSQISSSDYPLFKFPILSINITCLFLIILIFRKKIPENTVSVHNMT